MEIHFYEKPGCINNTKQKQLLEEKGHTIIAYNILSTKWTVENLALFFNEMPLESWFNKSAPRIKSGEVDPALFNKTTALNAMVADPFLIKRPLIKVGEHCACGIDSKLAQDLLQGIDVGYLLACPKMHTNKPCD